jgi:branched-chain amino acid transport system permease protein
MSRETLTLLVIYYGIATVVGGLVMSWRFTQLRRDAMTGAFSGFGAALIGFGIPGLAALYALMPTRTLGFAEEAASDAADVDIRFRFDNNVLWGMGAFGFTWVLLTILAANTEPSRFWVVVAGGVYEGMLIFLVAAGLSIIFGLMDVLNFAQGSLFMVGAYVAWEVFGDLSGWRDNSLGLASAFLLALIAATLAGMIVGFLMEILFIRPTYSRPFFQVVLTFGLALLLREIVITRYGAAPLANLDLRFPDGSSTILTGLFSGTKIQNYWLFMIVIGVLMIFGVQYLLQNTRIGIIIRAGVQDSEMVEALGINVRLIFTLVFALGAAIASLGGAVASGFLAPNPELGDTFLLQAIAVVIVGGLGSYSGTAVAAFVLGITGSVAAHFALVNYSSDALGSTTILIVLLIVLYIKPTGLFGKAH